MQAPRARTDGTVERTAILVRWPASRAMAQISTVPSAISGTSIAKSFLTRLGCVRDTVTWVPRAHEGAGVVVLLGEDAHLAGLAIKLCTRMFSCALGVQIGSKESTLDRLDDRVERDVLLANEPTQGGDVDIHDVSPRANSTWTCPGPSLSCGNRCTSPSTSRATPASSASSIRARP